MSHDHGANPMRWNCAKQGCFNRVKRPKIEIFADCLPGRIAFSDVDAIVEINGNLLLEWKDHQEISRGQRILFERITRLCPATVLVVEGDAETMEVDSIRTVWKGNIEKPVPANVELLRWYIRDWADYALANSAQCRARSAS